MKSKLGFYFRVQLHVDSAHADDPSSPLPVQSEVDFFKEHSEMKLSKNGVPSEPVPIGNGSLSKAATGKI